MLTYQVRERTFRLERGTKVSFPVDVVIEIEFSPLQTFGSGLDGGRTCVKAVAASCLFNMFTGHHSVTSETPLSPLDVFIQEEGRELQLSGNILTISQNIDSPEKLSSLIESLFFTLPMLLNIEFVDPPCIEKVSGKLGGFDFNWALSNWDMSLEPTTQELQEKKVVNSWKRYRILGEFGGLRLLAALHYYHVACRIGISPWEFMSEILLNYCKILEVLFPPEGESTSMETTRRELEKLGFAKKEIEKYYIPAIVLRNKIDVAHVDLSTFSRKHLQVLHSYSEEAETHFRDLLRTIFAKIETKLYSIPEHVDKEPRSDAIKTVESMAKYFGENHA